MTIVGAISRAQTLCYPLRIAAKVEDRPDDDGISVAGVKDPVGKNPAQASGGNLGKREDVSRP
jgi:hypothetical protein